jgi:hypothetical protein
VAATLIVQTDDGTTAGANSYLDTTEFLSYWADHGRDDYSSAAENDQNVALIRGTEYVDQR